MKNQRLVRARVKAAEHWPDWVCRCDAALRKYTGDPIVVDLATAKSTDVLCYWCGRRGSKQVVNVQDVADGLFIDIGVLDLDEVPPELQSDKYVESIAK